MTDTPETDAEAVFPSCNDSSDTSHPQGTHVATDFARRLERERDEWQINALLKLAVKQLGCMWCGELVHAPTGYEAGTPLNAEQRAQAYQQHVATCPAHPIRDVERERDEYKAALQSADNHNHEIATKLEIVTEQRDEAREQLDAERALADRLALQLKPLLIATWREKSPSKAELAMEAWKEARDGSR